MGKNVTIVANLMMLAVSATAWGITAGQVDTFESGTVLSWAGGASPTNVPTGGPNGTEDHYLRISSVSSGLAVRNDVQWSGNYLAAGVNGVAVDLLNQGSVELSMRVVLFNSPGGDFTTTTAIPLPADNQWHRLVFGLTAADLSHVGGGTGVLNDTLASVSRLVVRHQSGAPSGSGTASPVTSTLGIDNITAVPEPAALVLFAAGVLPVCRRRSQVRELRVG